MNTSVGPHVKSLQKFEAKSASHDLAITPGTDGGIDDGEKQKVGICVSALGLISKKIMLVIHL